MTLEKNKIQTENTYKQIDKKLELLLQTGAVLMENGANSSRIVRTMKQVAAYMDIPEEKLHIHVMYTTLMVNVSDSHHSITKFQKCYHHHVNMTLISAISELARCAPQQAYSLNEYERQLRVMTAKDRFYPKLLVTFGAGLACGGFCKLFGCDWPAFFYTAVSAMIGFHLRYLCSRIDLNAYIGIFIASFASTCCAFLTHYLPGSTTPWHPLMACALFIVPGIPLINAVDDLLDNYITAGITRAMNTLIMVGSMSFGIVSAIKLCRVDDFTALSMEPQGSYLIFAIAAAIAAVGFSTIFNAPPRLLWVIAIGAMIAVCTRNFIALELGVEMGIASFIGAMVVSSLSIKVKERFHIPNHVITIPSVIPMIPGVLMYRTLFGIININELDGHALMQAMQSGVNSSLIILAIAIGAAIPNIFSRKYLKI